MTGQATRSVPSTQVTASPPISIASGVTRTATRPSRPMSGFDNAKVDAAFFADGRWKSNFLINLGKADPAKIFPRNPRLTFDEACRVE